MDVVAEMNSVVDDDEDETGSASSATTNVSSTLPRDAEELDPVVEEIPVFLSKSAGDNLYLFQYPVRPATMPYPRESVRAARIKARQKRIELVVGVDPNCSNYDKSKGKQIVLNAQGTNPGEDDIVFHGGLMDKQTLSSTLAVDSTSRFAAGMLLRRKRKRETDAEDEDDDEGAPMPLELHLTPLHGIAQLRPSYEYLDHADVLKSKKENDGNSSMDEDEEEEVEAVTVRFARGAPRGGSNRGGGARNASSWRRMQKKLEEEPWITDIRWHGTMTPDELTKRLTKETEEAEKSRVLDLNEPPDNYLMSLLPSGMERKEKVAPAMPSNVLSLLELKDLSTADALLALLTNAKVMRFSQILQLLPPKATTNTGNAEILRLLQSIAVVIRGCWVVKSDILYPEKYCSRHSGVAASLLCRGRDYMLWKFTQSRNVIRKDIQSTTKLPADDILEMLNGVACMRHGHGWNFRLEQDFEFCTKHPDIVAKQNAFWDQKVKSLINQGLKINVHASTSTPDLHVKCRNRLNSEVSSSDDSDGGRRTSNSPRLPRKSSVHRSSKSGPTSPASKSPQRVRKGSLSKSKTNMQQSPLTTSTIRSLDFKDGVVHSAAAGAGGEKMEIEEIVPRVNGGGSDDAKEHRLVNGNALHRDDSANSTSVTKNGCSPEFSLFIREKLAKEMVLKLTDFKRMFQYRLAELDPGTGLGKSGFNEKMVESSVLEAGGVRLRIPWPKSSDFPEEPVYAWCAKEDGLNELRKTVIRIFSETGRITGKLFKVKLEEVWRNLMEKDNDECIPENIVKQLRTEYCTTKSAVLYLKNTVTN